MDPLAERHYSVSPYAYCGNNPVNRIDPEGMNYYSITGEDGQPTIQWQDSDKRWYVDESGKTWDFFSYGIKEVVVDRSSWGNQAAQFLDGAQYAIPVWGSAQMSGDALNSGDYLNAGVYFGMGLFEMFTLGYGAQLTQGVKMGATAGGKAVSGAVGGSAAKTGGKELYNFSVPAAKHMAETGRRVPLQLMDDVIKTTKGLPDPRGSGALMHYSPMWKNGKLYNLEILYDKASNSIWHFKYNPVKP